MTINFKAPEIKELKPRILVLGVGGNNTAEVINELKERDLSAFKAILSVSPYYNKPTQAGIFAHYEAVAAATSLPIILYNVPGRTGSNMLPETVLKLANTFGNIIGVKEAAGDMVQMMRLIKDRPEDGHKNEKQRRQIEQCSAPFMTERLLFELDPAAGGNVHELVAAKPEQKSGDRHQRSRQAKRQPRADCRQKDRC